MTNKELIELALKAREKSYSPYSNFSVGAALLCDDGEVFLGCNIEGATFTPTICAERTAFSKAISEGKMSFTKIAIVGGRHGELSPLCAPCGVCRQVMAEFCDNKFEIVLGTPDDIKVFTLEELLPLSFTKKEL